MQTLRKKTSPCKYKNEPSRFLGEGVSFKAKLIGILEVSEARGDRMCQEALADLKMAIRAAGEHKQRITINIAIDGLRLRDEKTGDSLYHHPVHKISFIAQDMSDSRAFGYIFGSPDTGHRFFGIKTDKAASQVVIAMRDLFQVVFELKKKEIELAKQHIEQKSRFSTNTTASLFSDTAISSSSSSNTNTNTIKNDSHTSSKLSSVNESAVLTSLSKAQASSSSEGATAARPGPGAESAIADLVDLELELSSIQQGIHQMERITPSDPFGPNKDDPFSTDPFGDSFTSFPQKPFLPPPPSARDRPSRNTSTSDTSSLFSPKTPKTTTTITMTTAGAVAVAAGGGASASSISVSGDTISQDAQSLFKTSHDEPSSCGWFTPTGGNDSLFEDALSVPVAAAEQLQAALNESPEQKQQKDSTTTNNSILSQFDVFTELDPLGTGRSKPYIDKKLFFQELKNPPKKVLKDLVTETLPVNSTNSDVVTSTTTTTTTQQLFNANFTTSTTTAVFQNDPFADDDPFDKADPFAEDDFTKAADPFDTEFVGVNHFKILNTATNEAKPTKSSDFIKTNETLQPLFPSPLSKSPNRFDVKFDLDADERQKRFTMHENPSLDMSSESECAPEPPPRPATNSLHSIKPPPLPPKKQAGDLAVKPPPRPPHTEEPHYDYMDNYETGHPATNVDSFESLEQTPPLPVPARKSRFFEGDFGSSAPQRPKKQFQSQSQSTTSDDDYLQPIAPPILPPQQNKTNTRNIQQGPILLPPPMKRDTSKRNQTNNVTVASYLESKPKLTSTTATEKLNLTADTLDITLSQLTLSGLNELASKLNIPASQLSNMTLVQLTSYLSNYMKTNTITTTATTTTTTTSTKNNDDTNDDDDATFPTFKADFSANFNDASKTTNKSEPYDRYAVFRELLQQENNKTDAETNKEESIIKTNDKENINLKTVEETIKPVFENSSSKTDRYAALRDIVIEDTISEVKENNLLQESNENSKDVDEEEEEEQLEEEKLQNDLNLESLKMKDDADIIHEVESNIIEYDTNTITNTNTNNTNTITITNTLSNTISKSPVLTKSPVPIAITEIIQTSNHLTSGSVSDVVSGSSPEVDNLATSEVVTKKNVENITRETWAIFDTPQHNNQRQQQQLQQQQHQQNNSNSNSNSNKRELIKANEKQVQSEEGVSPWSSDSKEFGNGSPQEWQQPRDSGSEGEWNRQRRRERDGTWWDSQGEREGHYEKPSRIGYTRERRSTDSYDDEWYEPDRPPRRRTRQQSHNWSKASIGGGSNERVIGDRERGQSSSSRDVSPWEEDEPRSRRERDECWRECRRGRGPSWDRDRHRRRDDSWDEEDDYEYEDEYISGKFHWPERHGSSRDSDRHSGPREPPDHWDSGGDQWPEERRHMRRRGHPLPPQEDRWTRPDWDHESDMVCGTKDKVRYNSSRWPNQESGKWRDRKRESDRYYKREHSQESPWEDDYSNDPDEPQSPRYLSARRNWKRPSSASEMDRKTGEIKSRAPYYMGTGGSDGERDRKYRANRRSRSRDSQFSDIPSHNTRHKVDTSQTLGRYSHRNRDKLYNQKFDGEDLKLDAANSKKAATLGRKKIKELPSPKIENEPTAPPPTNKVRSKQHLMFENDFVRSETESPPVIKTKFTFENDFETSETESPRYAKTSPRSEQKRINKQTIVFDESNTTNTNTKTDKLKQIKQQKSLFEDDFSPTEKPPINEDNNGITVIAEETVTETRVSFTENNLDKVTATETRRQSKNILSKSRIGNNRGDGTHIKKSESVNIFARENDPFDDDFFSGRNDEVIMEKVENSKLSPNNVAEFKWTEDFDSFDIPEEK